MSSERIEIYETLLIVSTIASSAASLTNLLLIYDMGVWSGFIALLTIMTVSQLFYDVTFYTNNAPTGSNINSSEELTGFIISSILQCFGGITQAIVSNQISILILYIVKSQQSFDIFKNFPLLAAIMLSPSAIILFIYFLSLGLQDPNTSATLRIFAEYGYFGVRLASVIGIVCTHLYTHYRVYRMTRNVTLTYKDLAIQTLIRRLQWYPIIQAVSRSIYSFYELEYTFFFNPFSNLSVDQECNNTTQFVFLLLTVLLTPVAAVGYLAVFLYMQPNAYKCLISRLTTGRRYLPPLKKKRPSRGFFTVDIRGNTSQSKYTYDDFDDQELLYELSVGDDRESNYFSRAGSVSAARSIVSPRITVVPVSILKPKGEIITEIHSRHSTVVENSVNSSKRLSSVFENNRNPLTLEMTNM